ncbi:hypothetical protein [Bacillus horti]|uniref:Uncharacterized protein n=1 Tax=Caldalkalibacillus horti TaxID=77523 RepID=A0ABT9VXQ3_9BACI|nr:hypothetical protein [Bacillus horti]MDQ0165774.1 hypothetical protein [Bacillus horti]
MDLYLLIEHDLLDLLYTFVSMLSLSLLFYYIHVKLELNRLIRSSHLNKGRLINRIIQLSELVVYWFLDWLHKLKPKIAPRHALFCKSLINVERR